MKKARHTIFQFICSLLFLLPVSVWAQSGEASLQDEMYVLEIQSRLQMFLDEWRGMIANIDFCPSDSVSNMELHMKQLDAKWLTYSQAQQIDIAAHESLLEIVGTIQVAKQAAQDALDQKKADVQMLKDFRDAEVFLASKDSVYRRLLKTAQRMALLKPMAAKLEKLKASEQLLFAEIQAHYDAAKKATDAMPVLQERMSKLESRYVVLKGASGKIQSAVYQPWITRIKDYLLGLAAVAVILMFFNMMTAKLKAIKQARQTARKLKQMLPGEEAQQYPVI